MLLTNAAMLREIAAEASLVGRLVARYRVVVIDFIPAYDGVLAINPAAVGYFPACNSAPWKLVNESPHS
jgi:hypothetical protein